MNRFDEIKNSELRAWNRCSVFFNLIRDKNVDAAKSYASMFSKEDVEQMIGVFDRIKINGYERTRSEVNKSCTSAAILA